MFGLYVNRHQKLAEVLQMAYCLYQIKIVQYHFGQTPKS